MHKRINKNSTKGIDLNQAAYQYFGGVDLLKIEGLSHSTILTIMSEVVPEGFTKFESSKQFTSWLKLAPNNKISGGKFSAIKYQKEVTGLKLLSDMQPTCLPAGRCNWKFKRYSSG